MFHVRPDLLPDGLSLYMTASTKDEKVFVSIHICAGLHIRVHECIHRGQSKQSPSLSLCEEDLVCSTLLVLGRSSVLVRLFLKLVSRTDRGVAVPQLLQPPWVLPALLGAAARLCPSPWGALPRLWVRPNVRAGAHGDGGLAVSPRQL